ncbi:MAG: nucleotide exchange factor GrpE [Bacteroidota bacterium]
MNKKSEDKKALDQEQQQSDNGQDKQQDEKKQTKEEATAQKEDNKQEKSQKEDSKEENRKAEKGGQKSKKKKPTKEDFQELEAKLEDQKDKFLRLYSEFENYRRRTSKEKLALSQTASSSLITKLLPVLDDYERAQKAYSENEDLNAFKEGIELIADKFWKILKQEGLEVIESTNKTFNTDEHEAITKMPAPSEDMKGKVIDTTEKGYKLNDKVIRYAKVVVGN